jgi:DnaK suppressor protein
MNKKDREYYNKLLIKEKERIYKNLGYLRQSLETGEKGIPTHIADHGTDEFEKYLEIGLSDSEAKLLSTIDIAIRKLESADFGKCEECGKNIPKSRLKAVPYARYCIACQRKKEKEESEE